MLFGACSGMLLIVHGLLTWLLWRRHRVWTDRAMIVIACASLFTGSYLALVRAFIVPQSVWNETRLAHSVAMLKGYPLYALPDQAAIANYCYGPVAAFCYTPAALVSLTPTAGLLAGAALAAMMFFIPAAWLLWRASPGGSIVSRIAALACFAAIVHNSGTLSNTGSWIHVDPPSLGFAACALVFLIRRGNEMWASRITVALFAALSIWSKQTLAPLAIVIPLWSLLTRGRKAAVVDASLLLGALVGFGLLFALTFNLHAMLFQMFVEPSHEPWESAGIGKWQASADVLRQMPNEILPLAIFLAVALLVRGGVAIRSGREWLAQNPWMLPAMVAMAMLPTAFLGCVKEGGAANNAAVITYFLLLAGCAALASCKAPWFLEHRSDGAEIGQLLIVMLAGILSIRACFDDGMLGWRLKTAVHPTLNCCEVAYRYERRHPGEVYFPWDPEASLLGSGRLYDFDYAVHDRIIAGFPPNPAEVHQHVPQNMRYIAYPPQLVPSLAMWGMMPEYSKTAHLHGLPKFMIYARRES